MYIWDSKQQAIAVVDAGGNECMDQRLCCVSCQVLSSSSDVEQVEIRRLAHFIYVRHHGHILIKSYSKVFCD